MVQHCCPFARSCLCRACVQSPGKPQRVAPMQYRLSTTLGCEHVQSPLFLHHMEENKSDRFNNRLNIVLICIRLLFPGTEEDGPCGSSSYTCFLMTLIYCDEFIVSSKAHVKHSAHLVLHEWLKHFLFNNYRSNFSTSDIFYFYILFIKSILLMQLFANAKQTSSNTMIGVRLKQHPCYSGVLIYMDLLFPHCLLCFIKISCGCLAKMASWKSIWRHEWIQCAAPSSASASID